MLEKQKTTYNIIKGDIAIGRPLCGIYMYIDRERIAYVC